MLGINGEEEEQPARRSARGKESVKSIAKGRVSGRRTEEDDGYGDQNHQDMVIAEEWQDAWSNVSATTSSRASLV